MSKATKMGMLKNGLQISLEQLMILADLAHLHNWREECVELIEVLYHQCDVNSQLSQGNFGERVA